MIHQNTSKRLIVSVLLDYFNFRIARMSKIAATSFFRELFFENTISHIFNILALPLLVIHQNTSNRLISVLVHYFNIIIALCIWIEMNGACQKIAAASSERFSDDYFSKFHFLTFLVLPLDLFYSPKYKWELNIIYGWLLQYQNCTVRLNQNI